MENTESGRGEREGLKKIVFCLVLNVYFPILGAFERNDSNDFICISLVAGVNIRKSKPVRMCVSLFEPN